MRVVVISDTHNRHNEVYLPFGDVLVHCGDATGRGTPGEVAAFVTWFEVQDYEHKIMIAGNHDFMFENEPFLARSLVDDRNFHYLEDSSVQIQDVLFYGTPWQPWFHDWAFNLERGPEIAKKWAQIPRATEFLITHGPPKNILDRTREGDRPGCFDLLERIKDIKPKVHAFGHIHESYGTYYNDYTLFANASICTRDYAPSNEAIILDKTETGWQFV